MSPETSTYTAHFKCSINIKGEKTRKGMKKSFITITSNLIVTGETLKGTCEFMY